MDLVGIGVLILGIAFLGLVFLLIKPIQKLTNVLQNVQKSTVELPQHVDDIMVQAKEGLQSGNDALLQINQQIKELSPIFTTAGDIGRSANQLSRSMSEAVLKMEHITEGSTELTHRKNLEAVYGALTLGYLFYKNNQIPKG